MKKKKVLVAAVVFLGVLAAVGISCNILLKNSRKTDVYSTEEKKVRYVKFNKPFLIDHFEITVIKTSLADSLKHNSKNLLEKEEGAEYFIINVKVKNENSESKNLPHSGNLLLGEAEYMIEIKEDVKITETGYGVFTEDIKHNESKESSIVFRIPVEYGDESIIWDVFGSGVKLRLQ